MREARAISALIEYYVENLRRLWRGGLVRDLAESEAGYVVALRELRGVVYALEKIGKPTNDIRMSAEMAQVVAKGALDRIEGLFGVASDEEERGAA